MIKTALTKRKDLLYWLLFGIISIFLLWKTQYGYATLDEAFYLNIPYRFLLGDRIFFDEWSNTQLAAVPLLLVLRTYLSLFGSTEGIYLFIRILYTILKVCISLLIVYKLQRYNPIAARIAALFFLLSASYGLMVISYNTLAFGGTLCFVLFLITNKSDRKQWVSYFLAGISLSIAVLGLPYVAIIFFVYLATAIILFRMVKTEKADWMNMFEMKAMWGVLAGIGFCIVLFLAYLFLHVSIKDILQTIPHILSSDPAHQAKKLWKIIPGFISRIVMRNEKNKGTLAIYALAAMEMAGIIKWKYDRKHGKKDKKVLEKWQIMHTVFSCIITISLLISYFFDHGYINYMIYIPNVLAVFLFVLYSEIDLVKNIFIRFWPIGMLLMFVEYLGSNTGFTGMSASSCVASAGSVFVISVILQENIRERKNFKRISISAYSSLFLTAFLMLNFLFLAYLRFTYVFWQEGGLPSLTTRINSGPQKGLFVTANDANHYYDMISDITIMTEKGEHQNVLLLADQSMWMVIKNNFATYSPLNYALSKGTATYYQYYEEHPEHIPDAIYADYQYKDIAEELIEKYDMIKCDGKDGIIAYLP